MSLQTPEQREASLQALRDLLAFLEAHPEVPFPQYSSLTGYLWRTDGTEAQRFATLFDIADTFGAEVIQDADGDRRTERRFGSLTLAVTALGGEEPKPDRRHVVTRPTPECLDERIEHVEAVTAR